MNDLSHATLANAREYEQVLWTHALVPDAKLRAEEIVEQFLPRFRTRTTWAEFDFSQVAALQESETEQWSREAEQIRVGGITINEWRKRHGMGEVAWGNVWHAPVNTQPVKDEHGVASPVADPPNPDPAMDPAAMLRAFDRPYILNGMR